MWKLENALMVFQSNWHLQTANSKQQHGHNTSHECNNSNWHCVWNRAYVNQAIQYFSFSMKKENREKTKKRMIALVCWRCWQRVCNVHAQFWKPIKFRTIRMCSREFWMKTRWWYIIWHGRHNIILWMTNAYWQIGLNRSGNLFVNSVCIVDS